MLQIVEVVIGKGIVAAESCQIRVEWKDFVYCVHTVVDPVSAVLVEKERAVGVDLDAEGETEDEED